MMSTLILYLVIIVVVAEAIALTRRVNDYSVCDTYLQLELTTQCGPSGYAMGFGYPICTKFIDNQPIFFPDGQAFLNCVRPCLADFISANVTGKITNCTVIKNTAFASHVPCYNKCRFCDVVIDNLPQFAVTFKITDFLSPIAIEQVLTVGVGCLQDPLGFLAGLLKLPLNVFCLVFPKARSCSKLANVLSG